MKDNKEHTMFSLRWTVLDEARAGGQIFMATGILFALWMEVDGGLFLAVADLDP